MTSRSLSFAFPASQTSTCTAFFLHSGISRVRPRTERDHVYAESILVGYTTWKRDDIKFFVNNCDELKNNWQGPDYDLNAKNCVDFARDFCQLILTTDTRRSPLEHESSCWPAEMSSSSLRLSSAAEHVVNGRRSGKMNGGTEVAENGKINGQHDHTNSTDHKRTSYRIDVASSSPSPPPKPYHSNPPLPLQLSARGSSCSSNAWSAAAGGSSSASDGRTTHASSIAPLENLDKLVKFLPKLGNLAISSHSRS